MLQDLETINSKLIGSKSPGPEKSGCPMPLNSANEYEEWKLKRLQRSTQSKQQSKLLKINLPIQLLELQLLESAV